MEHWPETSDWPLLIFSCGATEAGRSSNEGNKTGAECVLKMPETTGNASYKRPNWVDIYTLVILFFTLLTVAWYAYVTSEILDVDRRPYLAIAPVTYANGTLTSFAPEADRSVTIYINYIDFGKSPGAASIKRTVAISQVRLSSGPDLDPVAPIYKFVWPAPIQNIDLAQLPEPLTDGELSDLNTGHYPWLYLRAQILYGSYRTELCLEFKVTVGTSGSGATQKPVPILSPFQLCQDKASNYAD
jgi:hypothetical protein